MIKKLSLAFVFVLAAGAALLLPAGAETTATGTNPVGVRATWVGSQAAVVSGRPGAYYIPPDRRFFYLRCPCGKCTKSATLNLVPGSSPFVWELSGKEKLPTLSPSIHWFELDGQTTHWHGWLRNGYFID